MEGRWPVSIDRPDSEHGRQVEGRLERVLFRKRCRPGMQEPGRPCSTSMPAPYFHATDEPYWEVTHQNGEAFAAVAFDEDGDLHAMTGVVLSDGTVSIQAFNPSEQRFFITGTVKLTNGTYVIDAQGQVFDDFGLKPFGNGPSPCDPSGNPVLPPMVQQSVELLRGGRTRHDGDRPLPFRQGALSDRRSSRRFGGVVQNESPSLRHLFRFPSRQ